MKNRIIKLKSGQSFRMPTVNEARSSKRRAILRTPDSSLIMANNHMEAPSGEVCLLPNEALFTQDTFSEPLTKFATGWQDPEDIGSLLDFIAPPVEVGRRFEFKQAVNAEEFIIDVDDVRAIGASFKEVTYTDSTVLGKTLNKGLSIRLDKDQYTDPVKAQYQLTAKLLRRLKRNEYYRALTILSAAATATGSLQWTPGAAIGGATVSVDPDGDINNLLDLGHLSSGLFPTRLFYARDAWSKRFTNYGSQNTPAGYAGRTIKGPQGVADLLGVQKGMMSNAVFQSALAAKTLLLSNLVYAFIAQDGVDTEDPTNLKRFWSATESGGPIRVYSQVFAKYIEVIVEHYSTVIATSTLGCVSQPVT